MKNGYDENRKLLIEKALEMRRTRNLKGSEIAELLDIDPRTACGWLKSAGFSLSKHGKVSLNSDVFKNVDSECKAYWIGFIYADGYVSDKGNFELSLKLSDKSHVEKFKKFISFEGRIYTDSYRARLCLKDDKFVDNLKSNGVYPRKSLILKFPTEKQVPHNLINHFIRGYFDGDGCINDPEHHSIGIGLIGTEQFLLQVLKRVDISVKLKKDKKHNENIKSFAMTGENARKFMYFIYKDSSVLLERKKERFENHIKRFNKNGFPRSKR